MADAAAGAIGAWLHGVGVGAAHAASNFHNWVQSQPTLQQGVGDLVSGIINGSPAEAATPKRGVAAPAAGPSGPKAPVYTQAYLDSQPNFVQQAAGAASAAGGKAAAAAPSPVPTPLDVVRAAAVNNGGLSLSQLGSLSESVARTIPQQAKPVPMTSKEQAAAQYLTLANDFAIRSAQDPAYAKSQAGAAHQQLMENLRSVAATPNQINDVATGMPPLQGN